MKQILILSLGLSLVSAARSEPIDQRQRLAVELVELISTNRPSDTDFKQKVAAQIEEVLPRLELSAKDSELFRKAALGAAGSVTVDRMVNSIAKAYAKKLSEPELKGIVDFYKTDAGKAWLRENVSVEAERTAQQKILVAEVLEETLQRFEELKKQEPK